jgi:hypothetical protein
VSLRRRRARVEPLWNGRSSAAQVAQERNSLSVEIVCEAEQSDENNVESTPECVEKRQGPAFGQEYSSKGNEHF